MEATETLIMDKMNIPLNYIERMLIRKALKEMIELNKQAPTDYEYFKSQIEQYEALAEKFELTSEEKLLIED
jgi:alanyl-tRNA synthetase